MWLWGRMVHEWFTRIPSVETTFWSGLCKVEIMPSRISDEILQHIVRLSLEEYRQLDITRITGVNWPRCHYSKILKGHRRLDLLIGGILPIAKGFPHHGKTDTYCGWCVLMGFFKSQVKGPTNSSHWTSPVSAYYHLVPSCCGISLSQANTLP